jgi:hypothetical protein
MNTCLFLYIIVHNHTIAAVNNAIGHNAILVVVQNTVTENVNAQNQALTADIANPNVPKTVTNHATAVAHSIRFFVSSGFFFTQSATFAMIGVIVFNSSAMTGISAVQIVCCNSIFLAFSCDRLH